MNCVLIHLLVLISSHFVGTFEFNKSDEIKEIRICDGRVFITIPIHWTTKELSGCRTLITPDQAKWKGIGIGLSCVYDSQYPKKMDGKALILQFAKENKLGIVEQEKRVTVFQTKDYSEKDESGKLYVWHTNVHQAWVQFYLRLPEAQRTSEAGKELVTRTIPRLLDTLRYDHPNEAIDIVSNKESGIQSVAKGDHEINAAIAKAQATINEFRRSLETAGQRAKQFTVKAKFTVNGENEHIWIVELSPASGGFEGIVASQSNRQGFPKKGDKVVVQDRDISDWVYPDANKRMVGGFTLRILAERSKEKAPK